jgi:hypothetical protein
MYIAKHFFLRKINMGISFHNKVTDQVNLKDNFN